VTELALDVRSLSIRYGDLVGVADVSLQVRQGSIVALIGSNGAGKTTTLNAIGGLVPVATGQITWQGADITGQPAYAVVKRGLALSPEGWRRFVGQTVEQNLRLGATTLRNKSRLQTVLDRVLTIFARLAERRQQRAGTLSGGERQMLATGRALMSEPRMLLLDEQSVELALEIAQHAYVLQTGHSVLDGPAADLARDPEVQRIYLGP